MDFFEELMISISEDNSQENDRVCLITNEQLVEPIITLECNHSFNYNAIFNEVKNQKTIYNKLETQTLKRQQIKCPYCRNSQNKLLPKFKDEEEIIGVNSPLKYCMYLNNCDYVFKSGKRKGIVCNKPCNDSKCNFHYSLTSKSSETNVSNETNNVSNKKHKKSKKGKTCKATVKTKARYGLHCLNRAKENGYCMIHNKLYTPTNNLEIL